MVIRSNLVDGVMVLSPSGSIDTINAPDFQAEVIKSLQTNTQVEIDLAEVTYVSSAGLRAFLLGQKTAASRGASLVVKNVPPVVMQVLQVSGFAKLIHIE